MGIYLVLTKVTLTMVTLLVLQQMNVKVTADVTPCVSKQFDQVRVGNYLSRVQFLGLNIL